MTLGAGRWRVTRQLLTEGLPLAVLGAGIGIVIARVGLKAFVAMAPGGLSRLDEVAIDIRVLGFTAIVVLATAALFAVVPALQASRVAMVDAARDSSRTVNREQPSGSGCAACSCADRLRSPSCCSWAPA